MLKDFQSLSLPCDLAKECPSRLDVGLGAPSMNRAKAAQVNPKLEAAQAAQKPLVEGLASCQLSPKGVTMAPPELLPRGRDAA